jgi:uncharacterized protein YbjT (DUF2867 family)
MDSGVNHEPRGRFERPPRRPDRTQAAREGGAGARDVRQASSIAGAHAVTGDLKDRASLDAACRGVTTVITTANSARRGGADNVESVDLAGNRALIDAADQAGVRQFIFVSVATADPSSPVPLFAAKAKTDAHLRNSGMAWTIVAPHIFMDVWFPMLIGSALGAGRPVPLVGGGRRRHSFIAADDVAEFAARAVDHPAAMRQRLVLGGPAMSWSDVVGDNRADSGTACGGREPRAGVADPDASPSARSRNRRSRCRT